MLWQEQALETRITTPTLTPTLTRTGYQYRTTWVKGVPIPNKTELQIHVDHHRVINARRASYELVSPTW